MSNSGESHVLWGYVSGGLTFVSPFTFLVNHILGWIFVGVTTVSYIVAIILFIKSQKKIAGDKNKNILYETSFECSHPTPDEIYEEIEKQPPLLQETIAKNYIGIAVKWGGIFSNIQKLRDEFVIIAIAPRNQNIVFEASLKEFPIFRTLLPNTADIQVRGIVDFEYYSLIKLKNAEIITIKIEGQAIYEQNQTNN